MRLILRLTLLVFAFVCFVLAAIGVCHPKVNLTALGLAFLTASMIFP